MPFNFDQVFPRIAATLDRLSSPSQDYVLHPAIVDGLLQDHGAYLEQIAGDDPRHKSPSWWASNMLQWFSKEFTEKGTQIQARACACTEVQRSPLPCREFGVEARR